MILYKPKQGYWLKIIVFIAFFISDTFANAQKVVVAFEAFNLCYIGLSNPISIAVEGVEAKNLIVNTSDNCEILEQNGQLYLKGKHRGNGYIYVGAKKRRCVQWLDTQAVRIRPVPKAGARMGTLQDGYKGSIYAIAAQPGLYGLLGIGFDYEGVRVTVSSFNYIIYGSRGFLAHGKISGHAFDKKFRKELAHIRNGGKILFFNISSYMKYDDKLIDSITMLEPITINCTDGNSDKDKILTYDFSGTLDLRGQLSTVESKIPDDCFNDTCIMVGKWKFGIRCDLNGVDYYEVNYDTLGNVLSKKAFTNEGINLIDINFLNETYKEYYLNGRLKKEGKISGSHQYSGSSYFKTRSWWDKSTLESSYSKLNDQDINLVLVDEWKYYHENGKIKAFGCYSVTLVNCYHCEEPQYIYAPDGLWRFFDANGIQYHEEFYVNGDLRK